MLLLASWASAAAEPSACYAGFEVSQACITERGLDQKVATYHRKITEAMSRLGASYKIDLRVVNNPLEAGYNDVGDVFTEVVRETRLPTTRRFRRLSRGKTFSIADSLRMLLLIICSMPAPSILRAKMRRCARHIHNTFCGPAISFSFTIDRNG